MSKPDALAVALPVNNVFANENIQMLSFYSIIFGHSSLKLIFIISGLLSLRKLKLKVLYLDIMANNLVFAATSVCIKHCLLLYCTYVLYIVLSLLSHTHLLIYFTELFTDLFLIK